MHANFLLFIWKIVMNSFTSTAVVDKFPSIGAQIVIYFTPFIVDLYILFIFLFIVFT